MFILFSGEEITDLGEALGDAPVCEGEDFRYGPMAVVADQVVEGKLGFSVLDAGCCGFLSERRLVERAADFKAAKKSLGLPGKKRAKETRSIFNNARALARVALEQESRRGEQVVAVLFRDSDRTNTAGRGEWDDKRLSMLHGFEEEGFTRGVPMIPQPKSEAWVLCALKRTPYRGCDALEERSGNDASPKSLKAELAAMLGDVDVRDALCALLYGKKIDARRITMPSFVAFRTRLEEVVD